MKAPSKVFEDCYGFKEWIEQRKRKHIIRKELQILHPNSMRFYGKKGYFHIEV